MAFASRDLGINLSPEIAGGGPSGAGAPGGPGAAIGPGGPLIAFPTVWRWCCGWYTWWCGWVSCQWITIWCRWYTYCGFRTPCGPTWWIERPVQPDPEQMLAEVRQALHEDLAAVERMQQLSRAANDPAKQAELMQKFLKEEEDKLRQFGEKKNPGRRSRR